MEVIGRDYLPKDVCMIGTGKKCAGIKSAIAEAERMRDLNIKAKE